MLESGEFAGKIEGGREFNAVCSLKKELYAISNRITHVLVYKRQTDNWIKIDRKTMRVKDVHSLLTNGYHLYVCSMLVHVYNNLMQRMGKLSITHFAKGSLTFSRVDGEGR